MKTTFALLLAIAALALNAPTAFAADAPKTPTVPFAAPAVAQTVLYETIAFNLSTTWNVPVADVMVTSLLRNQLTDNRVISVAIRKLTRAADYRSIGAHAPPGLRSVGFAPLSPSTFNRPERHSFGATIVAGLTLIS